MHLWLKWTGEPLSRDWLHSSVKKSNTNVTQFDSYEFSDFQSKKTSFIFFQLILKNILLHCAEKSRKNFSQVQTECVILFNTFKINKTSIDFFYLICMEKIYLKDLKAALKFLVYFTQHLSKNHSQRIVKKITKFTDNMMWENTHQI